MLLKASRITNLTDARYFAAREVDFLGFNLEEGTPGYLEPMYMKAIREWVEGPKIVGEFAHSPLPVVREAARFYGLDAVQVVLPEEGAEALEALSGLEVILEIPDLPALAEGDGGLLHALLTSCPPFIRHFLLDFSKNPAAGKTLLTDPAFWKNLFEQFPVLLHLDATAEETSKILAETKPAGLSLSGGEEEKVGVKSYDEIDEILEGWQAS